MLMKSARLYQCARCTCQVIICSSCDRSNIYCNTGCAKQSRVLNHRKSNKLYQTSQKGKQKHAQRQRRYRARQANKVTEHGSIILPPCGLLPDKPNEAITPPKSAVTCCSLCGVTVSYSLRSGYLRCDRKIWPLGP